MTRRLTVPMTRSVDRRTVPSSIASVSRRPGPSALAAWVGGLAAASVLGPGLRRSRATFSANETRKAPSARTGSRRHRKQNRPCVDRAAREHCVSSHRPERIRATIGRKKRRRRNRERPRARDGVGHLAVEGHDSRRVKHGDLDRAVGIEVELERGLERRRVARIVLRRLVERPHEILVGDGVVHAVVNRVEKGGPRDPVSGRYLLPVGMGGGRLHDGGDRWSRYAGHGDRPSRLLRHLERVRWRGGRRGGRHG